MATAIRTLPRDISAFTGRRRELDRLVDAGSRAAESGQAVGIHVIDGMAGVGKTAFAVHAAHLLAPRFPDGQIFLDLHAHTPGQRPVDAGDALRVLLLTTGVAAHLLPADLDSRSAMWRDRLAGRRMLILLDDAASHEQVRPLLPATPGSLVLITSRRRLAALEDVVPLSLDTLHPAQASELFTRLAPASRSEPDAVAQVVDLCGYLPLAIGLLAGQLRHRPSWTVTHLAADLGTAQDRLADMQAENVAVTAAFDLSFNDLPAEKQRLFRRLGLHPGPDLDAYAAAALDDTDLTHARWALDTLYNHHLITEPARGRYRFHDLIRAYAHNLARHDAPAERDAAVDRLYSYYLRAAAAANRHIAWRSDPTEPPLAHSAAAVPDVDTRSKALEWLETERPNLTASVDHAAASGRYAHANHLAAAMYSFLRSAGHWDQALAIHQTAVTAARLDGDRLGQARALSDLGAMQRLTDDYPAATASLTEAIGLYRDLGDGQGQAEALNQLGVMQYLTGDYLAAAATLTEALTLHRGLGHRLGLANALTDLGIVQRLTGDYLAAAATLSDALDLYRDLANRNGQATALNQIGVAQHLTGNYPAATATLTDALDLYRDLGDRHGQAMALNDLGAVQHATGDYPAATATLTDALNLYRDLGHRLGQAEALTDLGIVQRLTGDYPAATATLTDALNLYRDLGRRLGEAMALNDLGAVQHATGDYPAATATLTDALDLYRDLGHRLGQAEALNRQGELLLVSSSRDDARERHDQALRLARELHNPLEEARALEGIGRCLIHARDTEDGVNHLQRALTIYRRIGVPETERVTATLAEFRSTTVVPDATGDHE
ncbi:hypothetical protein BCD48_00225 [Pseudofrankia sp. BMG5.36]|nr:hypothetical protein BCD48_00225 [Pseudofrankia sp. BMG5.36]